ncbi:MAG: glycine cleavage system protein GcvH [Candidatus Omnitrophica bacterium]|nr:glycine cleavage system protein GcvH [Candidatus Omnitrophota bacterium]MDD5440862.1 glycine cleavage system protein GcvH [Candidatus Omnitrophota bacterium]
MIKFSESHEWIKVYGDTAVLGISDYAQKELGDIVYVELPGVGTVLSKGDTIATLESTKAASEVYAPVDCEVLKVNEELISAPQLLNESPLDKGHIVKIKIKDMSQIETLMDEEAYKDFLSKQ